MISHLTEDQITRWFVGQATAAERQHVHQCRTCNGKVDRFQNTLGLFQAAVSNRVERTFGAPPTTNMIVQTHTAAGQFVFGSVVEQPSLLVSLKQAVADFLYPPKTETTVAPVDVQDIWSKRDSRVPQWMSVALHAAIVALLMIPAAMPNVLLPVATSVTMLIPTAPLLLPPGQGRTEGGGGGGGGMRTPTPPSKGLPPRGADQQLLPPMIEAKNFAPDLIVEPTIVAPALANLPQFSFITIGDPNGVAGPPSAGPGSLGGIGTGKGPGVGPGTGPGVGVGHDGGFGGDGPEVYGLVGGITPPVILVKTMPEYSEDGRKGRIQGSVDLLAVVNPDGSVRLERVEKSLGYGLDQKAIEAVQNWKFSPATKDGKPVAMRVRVTVNFSLR
jgi:protein TonB